MKNTGSLSLVMTNTIIFQINNIAPIALNVRFRSDGRSWGHRRTFVRGKTNARWIRRGGGAERFIR